MSKNLIPFDEDDAMVITANSANNLVTGWDAVIEYATIVIGDDEPLSESLEDGKYKISSDDDCLIVSVLEQKKGQWLVTPLDWC